MSRRHTPDPAPPPDSAGPVPADPGGGGDAFRAIVDSVHEYIFVLDPRGRVLYANPFAVEREGRTLESLRGLRLDEVFPPEIAARQLANVARVVETGQPVEVRAPSRIGGRALWLDTILSPVRDAGGALTAVVGLSRDVTAEVEARDAARASEERYRRFMSSTFDAILVHEDGILLEANPGAARFLGFDDPQALVGRHAADFIHPDDRPSLARRLREDPVGTWIGRVVHPDGRILHAEFASTVYEEDGRRLRLTAARNVSDRHDLDQERQKAERLESLGVLAAGIAHDFNNLLAAWLGNLEVVRCLSADRPAVLEHLDEAVRAVERATALTRQLLAFARGGAPMLQPAAIEGTLRDAAAFALRGANVECRFEVPADLWPAEVDLGQLAQVVHNLVLNAAQAMPGGGAVDVRAANLDLAPDEVPGLPAGRFVRIDVEDRGHGIPPRVLPRIFDPYFTTREGGTGLGLATTYAIVRNHAGRVTVDTREGQGSTFRVYLPASCEKRAPEQAPRPTSGPRDCRVLLMDDEPAIREVLGEMLGMLGCAWEEADRGETAVERFREARERGAPFDVVLLDLTVPGGLGGLDTLAAMRAMDPEIPAIASSGYSDDPVLARPARYGFQGVLAKPYRLADLEGALGRALAE